MNVPAKVEGLRPYLQESFRRVKDAINNPLSIDLPLILLKDGVERFKLWVNPAGATDLRITGTVAEPAILSLMGSAGANDYADYTYDGHNGDLDVSGNDVDGEGSLNLRPNAYVNIWRIPSGDSEPIKLRVGNNGLTQSVDVWFSDVAVEGRVESSAGPLILAANTGNVRIFTPTENGKLQIGNASFTETLDITHDGISARLYSSEGPITFASESGADALIISDGGVAINGLLELKDNVDIEFAIIGEIRTLAGDLNLTPSTGIVTLQDDTLDSMLRIGSAGIAQSIDITHDGADAIISTTVGRLLFAAFTTPVITGSRGGNAALASLLTALDSIGLISDTTTA